MEELRTDVLPVIDKGNFLGFISDTLIYEVNDRLLPVSACEIEDATAFVFEDKHIYEVMRVAAEHELKMVAVVDRQGVYKGVVTLQDAVNAFSETFTVQSEGAVIVLSMHMTDYSMHEISRVLESENAKILSSFIAADPLDASKIKVTLKLDKKELRHIRATLERFGYKVVDQYTEEVEASQDEDRIGNLFRFLDL
ncbi:hypothetical protein A3SI_16967 [Nitritalea halalkaliphila LW7]|uniref:CBS domain-containing protein n=1 Tax=Nitritalea halalkaliphila LW7 TaxID=1189621 RepID=I5BWD7_9BACT|nr:CBS domain-containing protein [Nitritalea halalkaliphila]EIM73889.1 hypothetical protein A3SI_16967 [Nitritalea halalkaliphila LW7]